MAHPKRAIVRRRLLHLVTVLSLLLCLATTTLYVRSFMRRDEIQTSIFRHHCRIATFPHHVHVILAGHASVSGETTTLTHGLDQYPAAPKYLQPRGSSTGAYWEISIPFWLLLLFFSAAPIYWLLGPHRVCAKRRRLGLCLDCGYDLRATPDRCPECGTERFLTADERG